MVAYTLCKSRRLSVLAFLVLAIFALRCNPETAPSGTLFGQELPGREPAVFLPEIVSAQGGPRGKITFAPDGSEVFWSVIIKEQPREIIYRVTYDGKEFSEPAAAPFTEGYRRGGPALSHDGEKLFFSARRPYPDDESAPV